MAYLKCSHCKHPNEVKTEYLTFCGSCGKKLANNFQDWIREHPGSSFNDYESAVCQSFILHWEPETRPPAGRRIIQGKHALYIVSAAALMVLITMWATLKGPEVADSIEEWALEKIRFTSADTDLWETTVVRDGNFQIKFPATPGIRHENIETVMGPLQVTTYYVEPDNMDDENLIYSASLINYPAEVIASRLGNGEQTEQFLNYTLEEIIKRHDAGLISEKNIAYGLFPGKEVLLDYNHGLAEIKCRLYLVDNKLYTLKVTYIPRNNHNKPRDFFLNSFKLLEYAYAE